MPLLTFTGQNFSLGHKVACTRLCLNIEFSRLQEMYFCHENRFTRIQCLNKFAGAAVFLSESCRDLRRLREKHYIEMVCVHSFAEGF